MGEFLNLISTFFFHIQNMLSFKSFLFFYLLSEDSLYVTQLSQLGFGKDSSLKKITKCILILLGNFGMLVYIP